MNAASVLSISTVIVFSVLSDSAVSFASFTAFSIAAVSSFLSLASSFSAASSTLSFAVRTSWVLPIKLPETFIRFPAASVRPAAESAKVMQLLMSPLRSSILSARSESS